MTNVKETLMRHHDVMSTRKHRNNNSAEKCAVKKLRSSAMSLWLSSPVAPNRVVNLTITPAKTQEKSLSLSKQHPPTQSYIDVGQRDFGKHVTCLTCGLLYTAGEEEDEKEHQKFCKRMKRGVSFSKWKMERILTTFLDTRARILEIRRDDPKPHVKKLLEIKAVLDDALGFVSENVFLQRSHFVYIQDQQVVGCVNTERIAKAFTLDKSVSNMVKFDKESSIAEKGVFTASATSQLAVVGICQIWVHPSFRKKTIATRLVDIVCGKSIYGMRVAKNVVAFAQPTRIGLQFAQKYMRPYDVLIY
ncbi:unnamed protein product [Peronospora destructor]|uniref:N-acetyltransferase domain-containing protein n=1 Tax=Peronospora destructor TaxID=86335 RepID=A0AAV0T1V0_9STRA|nr:unnamed protein product [Peronospora destructor]